MNMKTNTNHNTTLQDNLSHKQRRESLTDLYRQKRQTSIVKLADKGGAIVIRPRELYLKEAHKQLNNNLHYKLIQIKTTISNID